jgi:GGDEF domain-containing protein
MSDDPRSPDALALASEVGLTIAAIADLDELLSAIARRVAEALDVWECDIYEYRPDSESLVATALWSREVTETDLEWLGTVYDLAERPSYAQVVHERSLREFHVDDPEADGHDVELMRRWGEQSVLSVALVFADEVVGALTLVETRRPRRFSELDLHLVELLAVPAAVALHNARMFRREAEQKRRLEALVSASRAMASATTLEELLTTIATAAGRALDADECAINTYDAASDTITITAYHQKVETEDPADWIGQSYDLHEYHADREHLLGGAITEEHVSDPATDETNRQHMQRHDEKTHLSVPLHVDGVPLGVLLFVQLHEERHFTDEERQIAAVLGEQAAAAIHKATLLRTTEEQKDRLAVILESMRAMSSSMDLDEVLATVARTTAQALGAEQCQIQEYDATACTVTPVAYWQRDTSRPEPPTMHVTFSLEDEPEERDFLEGRKVVQQVYSDPGLAENTRRIMDKYGDRSYLNVPLITNDESVGLLVLVETEYDREWTDEDVEVATALADQAAVVIEHARLYRRVQAQALTDGLTGLYNHRYFYDRLEQEIARARRYGTPVSLLMIDIDDFKAFNDRHGHPAGDTVLRTMAGILEAELRHNIDIAARYGGEEFAVILPNTPMEAGGLRQMEMDMTGTLEGDVGPPAPGHNDGAEAVAERIRRRMGETPFAASDGSPLTPLTVSVGVAVFPHRTSTPEDLVANADAALYKAKRGGKDRVETFG